MAGNVQISIKDEQSARQWLALVQEINQDYLIAMQDAAATLDDMQNFADGTLVDDFVGFGTDLLNAAQTVFEGIDEIADTVTTIIGTVGEFVDSAKGFIKGAINQIFGR